MYSLNMPVSRIRTKVREEYEKHRYVNNIQAVDVLLQQSQAEFQVGFDNPRIDGLWQNWILTTACVLDRRF